MSGLGSVLISGDKLWIFIRECSSVLYVGIAQELGILAEFEVGTWSSVLSGELCLIQGRPFKRG